MPFTTITSTTFETQDADAFGAGGRTTAFRTATIKQTGADREHHQVHKLSADLSAVSIALAPLGTDAATASNMLLWLLADQPVDVRIGSATHSVLSNVRQLLLQATISGLFLTTGSKVTTVRTMGTGGSGASITASKPIP